MPETTTPTTGTLDDHLRWLANMAFAEGDAEAKKEFARAEHYHDERVPRHQRRIRELFAAVEAERDGYRAELQRVAEECGQPDAWKSAAQLVRAKLMHYDDLLAEHHARLADPRSNGTTIGHAPDVLPQGMTFHAGELGDAYVAGATSGREHQPTDEQIARAADSYVKYAHLRRLDAAEAAAWRLANPGVSHRTSITET